MNMKKALGRLDDSAKRVCPRLELEFLSDRFQIFIAVACLLNSNESVAIHRDEISCLSDEDIDRLLNARVTVALMRIRDSVTQHIKELSE